MTYSRNCFLHLLESNAYSSTKQFARSLNCEKFWTNRTNTLSLHLIIAKMRYDMIFNHSCHKCGFRAIIHS